MTGMPFSRASFLKKVVNAFYQWVFGAHDHHVDAVVEHELFDAFEIVGLEGDIVSHVGSSSVAGRDVELLHFLALGYFPGQGVFAASAA